MSKLKWFLLIPIVLLSLTSLVGCMPANVRADCDAREQRFVDFKAKLDKETAEQEAADKFRSMAGDMIDKPVVYEWVNFKGAIDGNTIVVQSEKGQETIKLIALEAPHITISEDDTNPPTMLYSVEAKEHLEQLLSGSGGVWLERGGVDHDQSGVVVGYVWYAHGSEVESKLSLNIKMILDGYARIDVDLDDMDNIKHLGDFKTAQDLAKDNELNIWSVDGYVTPDGFDEAMVK